MFDKDMGETMYVDAIASENARKAGREIVEYINDCFACIGISDIDKRVEKRRKYKEIASQVASIKDSNIVRSLKVDANYLRDMIKDVEPVVDGDMLYEIAQDMLKAVAEIQRLEQHVAELVNNE